MRAVILCNEESSARSRTIQAAAATSSWERSLQAGTVSWMVPICQALQEGGIWAAYERYAEIKGGDEYILDETISST